jgi:hypothetical protein
VIFLVTLLCKLYSVALILPKRLRYLPSMENQAQSPPAKCGKAKCKRLANPLFKRCDHCRQAEAARARRKREEEKSAKDASLKRKNQEEHDSRDAPCPPCATESDRMPSGRNFGDDQDLEIEEVSIHLLISIMLLP